ncbi:unnamed protein product [Meloidogyne enterolobii]|uniref:Uncharacterized protein n=1 Tax=Meloidogyne enterolobii TaxID=390850 RepID=A0ACB0XZ21_MELEN
MKIINILIIIILNAIFWSLINSVKNNKEKKELTRVEETSKNSTPFNDGVESSADPQIKEYEKTVKPKSKIAKGTTIGIEGKKFKKNENIKDYFQNKKEKKREYDREYYQNNKEKRKETERKYYQKNREKKRERNQKYYQNNKEKKRERQRKYRERRKNKKADLQNDHSDNGETSFVNTQNVDFGNKGKLPIVYEENIRSEEENHFNQEEEECNKDETENYVEEQNQSVVEEAKMNQIDLNEKYYQFDLNEEPEDIDEDVC